MTTTSICSSELTTMLMPLAFLEVMSQPLTIAATDDVIDYNVDGINMAVSWNPVMDGTTADADTDWEFNMQGPKLCDTALWVR